MQLHQKVSFRWGPIRHCSRCRLTWTCSWRCSAARWSIRSGPAPGWWGRARTGPSRPGRWRRTGVEPRPTASSKPGTFWGSWGSLLSGKCPFYLSWLCPRGHHVIECALVCGASSPGFDSHCIQMFFLLSGIWWKKEPVIIKVHDLGRKSPKQVLPCHLWSNIVG